MMPQFPERVPWSSSAREIAVLHFTDLIPLTALEPFPGANNRRSMTLDQLRFEFIP